MYVIEDELHAEHQGEFASLGEVVAELRRLASVPWNEDPNRAPCMSWTTCGREYEVIEYDTNQEPWRQISRVSALSISANGVVWSSGFQHA